MIKRAKAGIYLSLFLFCTVISANSLRRGPVYENEPGRFSIAVTLPPDQTIAPLATDFKLVDGNSIIAVADTTESFAESGKIMSVMMCVDVSGSIPPKDFSAIQDALIQLTDKSMAKRGYNYGLFTFASSVDTSFLLSNELSGIGNTIKQLKRSTGVTTLFYKGVDQCLDELNKQPSTDYKVLLVISDGKEEPSSSTDVEDTLIEKSNRSLISIDTFASGIIEMTPEKRLKKLAEDTGGQFFNPRAEMKSLKKDILKTVATQFLQNLINNTWIVSFNFEGNAQKSKLDNPTITFQDKDSITLSGLALQSSMANKGTKFDGANVTTDENNVADKTVSHTIDWKKIESFLPYILFALLTLLTLIFIAWIIHRKTAGTDEDEKPSGSINLPPTYEAPKSSRRDKTSVITFYEPHLQQPLINLALLVIDGPLQGKKFVINAPQFQIGANTNNDLVLDDDYVSGNHALLIYDDSTLQLTDLHSRNGTFVNGELLKDRPIILVQGDVIRIGNSTIKIVDN